MKRLNRKHLALSLIICAVFLSLALAVEVGASEALSALCGSEGADIAICAAAGSGTAGIGAVASAEAAGEQMCLIDDSSVKIKRSEINQICNAFRQYPGRWGKLRAEELELAFLTYERYLKFRNSSSLNPVNIILDPIRKAQWRNYRERLEKVRAERQKYEWNCDRGLIWDRGYETYKQMNKWGIYYKIPLAARTVDMFREADRFAAKAAASDFWENWWIPFGSTYNRIRMDRKASDLREDMKKLGEGISISEQRRLVQYVQLHAGIGPYGYYKTGCGIFGGLCSSDGRDFSVKNEEQCSSGPVTPNISGEVGRTERAERVAKDDGSSGSSMGETCQKRIASYRNYMQVVENSCDRSQLEGAREEFNEIDARYRELVK